MTVGAMGITTIDSAVYNYDAAGNLTSQMNYMTNNFAPAVIIGRTKWDYVYSNGNLVGQTAWNDMTGTMKETAKYKFTYDDKTNPMKVNGEFILTGQPERASKNNMVKMEMTDMMTGGNNVELASVFSYDASGKPATAVVTQQPGNVKTNYTFYYQ
jgi:hypothetical protein